MEEEHKSNRKKKNRDFYIYSWKKNINNDYEIFKTDPKYIELLQQLEEINDKRFDVNYDFIKISQLCIAHENAKKPQSFEYMRNKIKSEELRSEEKILVEEIGKIKKEIEKIKEEKIKTDPEYAEIIKKRKEEEDEERKKELRSSTHNPYVTTPGMYTPYASTPGMYTPYTSTPGMRNPYASTPGMRNPLPARQPVMRNPPLARQPVMRNPPPAGPQKE
jgi:hypothetical protein